MNLRQSAIRFLRLLPLCMVLLSGVGLAAQTVTQVGLRSVNGQGRFRGLKQDSAGNLYTLLDAADGVRVVKMDAAAATVLAETHLGQAGDQAVAIAIDPAGNVYVTGTSLSTGSIAGTTGTSYPARADSTTNSFLAKFSPSLTEQWLTFLGSGRMAATAVDASSSQVVVTGSIYASTLPVTANGIQQQPLPGSNGNGFVESFNPATGTIAYSTYLSGANGDTSPAGIALDANSNAYIVGSTTASGFPTTNALVPLLLTDQSSPISGFLTRLTASGSGFSFSTFVPGSGLSAVSFDASSGTLLLSGNLAPGLFPVTQVQAPVAAAASYQYALRMPLDGSAVTSATLLAPGDTSTVAGAGSGLVAGVSSESANVTSLLPVAPLQTQGAGFLLVADANGNVQRTARVGAIPANNLGSSSVPVSAGGVLASTDGSAIFAGGIAPTLSSALLATERFDVALGPAATNALPSAVRDALPPATCNGSACAGGAGVIERMAASTAASLLLSVDNLPNVVVRNLGGAQATGLQVSATGYTVTSACGGTLPAGSECDVFLTGSGPGTIMVRAANATTVTANLPANTAAPNLLSVVPKELDFGVTAYATPRTRTLTITNLSASPQTFASRSGLTTTTRNGTSTLPYTVAETASTCTPVGDGVNKTLAAGASCTISLQLGALNSAASDGMVRSVWIVGPREVNLTGYTQASAPTLSATHIGFGRQYGGGLRIPRYLYLSNGSDIAQAHTPVALAPSLPFQLTDACPTTLAPQSVCQIAIRYASATVPSSDATTVLIDGTSVLIDGQTVPPASVTGATSNPNLSVSPTSVIFAQPVVVTTAGTETQSVTIRNTGAVDFMLNVAVTGDFTASTCPSTLAGGSSCVVTLHFAPSDAGTRQGLLSVSAGSSSPVYVMLSGTATGFIASNGIINFGDVPVQSPAVLWYKVGQPFVSLTASASSADYRLILVEDTGYGHGSPDRNRFRQNVTGSCLNCYLGVEFLPSVAGANLATLSLSSTSGGATQTLALSGSGVPATGLVISPSTYDFSSLPIGSVSGAAIFTVMNATAGPVATSVASFTGDFAESTAATGGTACGGTLAAGESCTVAVQFAPSLTGPRGGSLTVSAAGSTASATLVGYGDADPGIHFAPASLLFRNVPGATAMTQALTVTNSGALTATIGIATSSDAHFQVASTCASIAPGASCTVNVTYAAGASLASGILTLPVTTAPGGAVQTTNYTFNLAGLYTSQNAGIQIVPGEETEVNLGAVAVGGVSTQRVFRVNNLSGKALRVALEAPRQFPITATTCGGLAAGASCTVTLVYAPVLNADATGSLFVQGQPTDGSATLNGLAYLEGYGTGTAMVAVSGNLSASGVVDFGQVAAGQSATQTLTVRNQSSSDSLTVRRIRVDAPFSATTTCGVTLSPAATCSVALTYAPNATATAAGSGTQSDAGVLTIESDAVNSPLLVNLAGRTVPQTGGGAAANSIAALTTSQGALTFANGTVGTASAVQTVTVANTGTAALTINGVVTTSDFKAASNCGQLPVGASCQVSVAFTPQAAGTRSASLQIQSNAANALEYVSLLGNGTPASVTLAPTSLSFGQVLVGATSAAEAATLTNTGSSAVTVGAIGVSGDFAIAMQSGATPACSTGTTLAAGAACAVGVTFSPARTGTRSGSVSVASSATALPLTVALSGVGVQPQLAASPGTLNFGDVLTGKSQTFALTLSNVSTLAVNALQIGISSGDFSVLGNCGPVTLAAGSSCSLNVTFKPTQAGPRSGTLTVTSSDPASPLTIALTGNGLQGGSFTLTANGTATASATVRYGVAATYALALTPTGGFTGDVAFTCTPQAIVQYAACSIVPSTVTLTNGAVSATATITTVTAVAATRPSAAMSALPVLLLCGLPFILGVFRKRRRVLPLLLAAMLSVGLLLSAGCGGGVGADPRIRYAANGTYQFIVTAASTTGVPVQQSVNLTLTITGN